MTVSSVTGWIKTRLILILSLLVLLSGGFGYFAYSQWRKSVREAQKWESNYNSERTKHLKTSERGELTKKELKEEKELVELLKSEKIKERKTQFIYRVHYRDTGSVKVKVEYRYIGIDSTEKWDWPITSYYEEPGYQSYWTYYPKEDSAVHQWEKQTNLAVIGHWEREREFRIFGKTLFHFGRRSNYVTVKDLFTDSEILKNQYIEIKRR